MPVYFISHGGGPWPWLEGRMRETHRELEKSLVNLPRELPEKPKAILMISGHWEEDGFSIMSSQNPSLLYDYSGFPEHTYSVQYSAPGSPELATQVQSLLRTTGISARLDSKRGFDHGTFVPLAVSFPKADIPVIQLSIRADYDPEIHIKVGHALEALREEGVLIIGSGLSFHNLDLLRQGGEKPSREFDTWLQDTLLSSSPEERSSRLLHWEQAPSARTAHPQADHLLPLMVAVGAAGSDAGSLIYHDHHFFAGVTESSFRFG